MNQYQIPVDLGDVRVVGGEHGVPAFGGSQRHVHIDDVRMGRLTDLDADLPGTVTLSRRAYSPVLRQSGLPAQTTIPWWPDRRLHFRFD